jgi:hypothetical protein
VAEALELGVPPSSPTCRSSARSPGRCAVRAGTDAAAFAAAVRSLDDTARLAEVVAAGTAHIARFDWARSAGVLLDAVRKASRRRT